jgi:hypothetical protein
MTQLAPLNGRIDSAAPDIGFTSVGFAVEDFQGLSSALDTLRDSDVVDAASYDFLMDSTFVPGERTTPAPSSSFRPWRWTDDPALWIRVRPDENLDETLIASGNWGDRYIGAPTVWNLVPALGRVADVADNPVHIGIVDVAKFYKHPDLVTPDRTRSPYKNWPSNTAILTLHGKSFGAPQQWRDPASEFAQTVGAAHGTTIAGLIAGEWGNQRYVDGLLPFARLHAVVDAAPGRLDPT